MRINERRIILHLIIWLAVYMLPFFASTGYISLHQLFGEPGAATHLISTALLVLYAYINYYFLVPKYYLHRRYIVYASLVVASVLIVIWLPQLYRLFEDMGGPPSGGPPTGKPPHGRPPSGGPPSMGIPKMSYNVVLFVISTFASISIRQQQQLLEVQKEKLDAELSFLKAQINPHFLFNTLNSIYALSIQKSNDTPSAIVQLSELMRYILKDSDADTVPLDKELNYINNYVALQKRRLGSTVAIEYTAPTGIINGQVAPLILMSFVENAFKHGVNPDQDSAIRISIQVKDGQLHLQVVNNKVSAINQNETMGIGLKNAVSRLEHLYSGKHQLTIEDGEKIYSVNLILHLHD